MWSDNDIDNAFQRLNPPDPEPTPFPLDAWLRLETELDKAVIERAVRQKLWRFFAAEVAVVALVVLGWLLWPSSEPAATGSAAPTVALSSARTAAANAGGPASTKQSTSAAAKAAVSTAASTNSTAPNIPLTARPTTVAPSVAPLSATSVAAEKSLTAPGSISASHAPTVVAQPQLLAAAATGTHHKMHKLRQPAETQTARFGANAGATSSAATGATAATGASALARQKSEEAAFAIRHNTAGSTKTPAIAPTGAIASATTSASKRRAIKDGATSGFAAKTAPSHSKTGPFATANSRNRILRTHEQPETPAAVVPNTSAEIVDNRVDNHFSVDNQQSADELAGAALRPVALQMAATSALPALLATVALAETPKPVAPVRQPRFYIGLVGAPDVTTVKFASVESPLPNVGVTLEYRITNRLRVSTGLLRSHKQYMARRDDYDWGAYRDFVYKHDFNDVDGTCTVLDIPLNLRYDLIVQPQYRVFGSAGLSSFFMQREHYTYDYEENNMYKVWDPGEIVNQNKHLLSILNLSLGYERSLSTRWSLQAEPYLKVPLAGVGAGKVKLTSAGVFLGVKYGF